MGRLLLYGIGAILAIAVAIKLAGALLGAVLGLVWFAVVKLLPIVLLGWFVLWLWRRWKRQPA